ncbi:outer membrane lipoprotein-sorting protein [Amphritea pacifica]|uniref:Outer membrane lipoprotein-sorting protein n=1 Tax=Amphritea pacifica TaxID=2811233 RepID=A0ABS2W6L4_9GAMM|nr:outer membrane lipoprotein-sorting protein [Amphritea pacifica]MBN0987281.1 outer membrane lipoprotein-sorting protein [Amphritea pacifica]MBN1005771.1 outer membrane lipoprotein-sorting protein [Amphritea pacifica]
MNLTKSFYLLLSLTIFSGPVLAQTPEERGLEIAREVKQRDFGWADMQAEMLMVLRNKQGEESVREIRIKSLEQEGDGDKSLTIFDKPLDVKGTAFLSFSHPLEADDQWLYLPALKRVKRISSRNKSGPFMGSEFAYEDLSSFEIEKYSYKYIRDESCEGGTCFVVEQYPVDKDSGYTRRVAWIDQDQYRVWKVEFYDRKNSLLKTLNFKGYQQYLDKYWRADLQQMINHQTGKSTDLKWSGYQFRVGLNDSDFNKNTLKRAR